MRAWLRDHGLLLANLALFVIFIGGMVLSGDDLATIPAARAAMLRRLLPPTARRAGMGLWFW